MEKGMPSLELSMMPVNQSAIMLDDKMLVMDNLSLSPDDSMDSGLNDFMNRFPLKLSAACILIVVRGSVKFGVNFRDFEATDNSCAIISAGTIVERVEVAPGTRTIFLSFAQNNLPALANIHQRNVNILYAMQVVHLRLQPVHVELLKTTYQTLRTILTDPSIDLGKSEAAFNCINLLGSIIALGVGNQPELAAKASRKDEIVARFLQCVHENYRVRRDLGFYADQLCLSLKYMSHVVFEQTGRHPSRWIKDYVILDAKTMLRSGRYTVQQVADELNFPNQSFFGKYFKEAVGVSPKKWQ